MPETKFCSQCDVEQPLDNYHKDRSKRDGVRSECKACIKQKMSAHYARNSERIKESVREYRRRNRIACRLSGRAAHLRSAYGLSVEDYEALLAEQGGRCAICGRPPRGVHRGGRPQVLAVDHDHVTGRVRGLLCSPCNSALGRLGDTPEALERVLGYLRGGG